MSVKRALKLDTLKKDNTRKENLNSYSPTTGTRQMSPFSSPMSVTAQNPRSDPANEGGRELKDSESSLPRRGQPQTEEEEELMELQSSVSSSLGRILKIRADLTSLQALEGSKELENLLDVSASSCSLSAEVQKTQELMSQAAELQLWKRNQGKLPSQGFCGPGPGDTTARGSKAEASGDSSCCLTLHNLQLLRGGEGSKEYLQTASSSLFLQSLLK